MVRKRQRRRRLNRPSPSATSLALVFLALHSVPLFRPAATPGSAGGVAAAAVAAAVANSPSPGGKESDAGDTTAHGPQRQRGPPGRSLPDSGIEGKGHQGPAVQRGLGDTDEEVDNQRTAAGEVPSVKETPGWRKPACHHGEGEALLSQQPRGSSSSSSSSSNSNSSGGEEDGTRTPRKERLTGVTHGSKDSTANAGSRPVRPLTPEPTAGDTAAAPELLVSASERGASAGKTCRASDRGGSGNGDGGVGGDDRWAAQTLGTPVPMMRQPAGEAAGVLAFSSPSRTLQTIGGTLPRVLEDSAWCSGGEGCLSAPSARTYGGREESVVEEQAVVGGSASDGLGFDSSRTVQTVGGTLPRTLEDSAWWSGEQGLPSAPPAAAEKEREETVEEQMVFGGSVSGGLGFGASRSVQTVGGTLPRTLGDAAWCEGEEGCSSGSADEKREEEERGKEAAVGGSGGAVDSVLPAGCRARADGDEDAAVAATPPGRDGGLAAASETPSRPGAARGERDGENAGGERRAGGGQVATDAAASCESNNGAAAAAAAVQGTKQPIPDGGDVAREDATAVRPFPDKPTGTKSEGDFPTVAPRAPSAAERPSRQEQRGPLVKGEGANTNTKIDARDGGGIDRAHHQETALDAGGASGGEGLDLRRRRPVAGGRRGGRGRDPSAETPDEGTEEEEGHQEGEEGGREGDQGIFGRFVLGKARYSWRAFASVLLLCGVAFGTFLQGSLPTWFPFLGGDSRESWMLDLDSAIATARSRAGLCSGRPGVFSGDPPADDSDLPDLVSDDEDDEEEHDERTGAGRGPKANSGGFGEAPLMWDTRPKPDDYLVFHPVLGVVPAGAVRAWGGDGRGGWSGGRVRRKAGAAAAATAAAAAAAAAGGVAATNGGSGGVEESVLSSSSPLSLSFRSFLPRRAVGGDKPSSKEVVVGSGEGGRKELAPVRNTDEWLRCLASRTAAGEAAASAAAAAEVQPAPASPANVSGKEKASEAAVAVAAAVVAVTPEIASAEAPRQGASAPSPATAVPAEAADREVGPAGDAESEKERGGHRQKTTSANGVSTAGARKAAATPGAAELADPRQQPPSDLSHTPTAISLQFGVGGGEPVCGGVGTGGSGRGSGSTERGLSWQGNGAEDEGEDSFSSGDGGTGGEGGGGGGGRRSSEDGSSNRDVVMAADCSPRQLSLPSAEQPPPLTAAFQVS